MINLTSFSSIFIANWKLNGNKAFIKEYYQKLSPGKGNCVIVCSPNIYLSQLYSNNKNNQINQIQGKQLSYNNYNDILSALTISKSLPKNTGTIIVKHANPCGVSILNNNIESYKSALACDPISAFGGVVSCNFKVTHSLALELNKIFLEVIIANGFDQKSLKIFKSKKI